MAQPIVASRSVFCRTLEIHELPRSELEVFPPQSFLFSFGRMTNRLQVTVPPLTFRSQFSSTDLVPYPSPRVLSHGRITPRDPEFPCRRGWAGKRNRGTCALPPALEPLDGGPSRGPQNNPQKKPPKTKNPPPFPPPPPWESLGQGAFNISSPHFIFFAILGDQGRWTTGFNSRLPR